MKMFIKRITVFLFIFAMGFAFFSVKFHIYRKAFLSCAHADDKKEDSMEKKKKEDEGKKESYEEEEAEGEQEILVDPAAGFVDDLIIWKQTKGIIKGIKEKESSGMLKEEAREELSEARKLLEGTLNEKFMWKTYRKRFKTGEEVIEHLEEAMENGGPSTVELQDQVVQIFHDIDTGFVIGLEKYIPAFDGAPDTDAFALLEKAKILIQKGEERRRNGKRRKAIQQYRQAFPLLQKTLDANFTKEQARIIKQAQKDYAIMIEAKRTRNFQLVKGLLNAFAQERLKELLTDENFTDAEMIEAAKSLNPIYPKDLDNPSYLIFRSSLTDRELNKHFGASLSAALADDGTLVWGDLP